MHNNSENNDLVKNFDNIKFMLFNNHLNEEHILIYSAHLLGEIANHNPHLRTNNKEIRMIVIIFIKACIKKYIGFRNARCDIIYNLDDSIMGFSYLNLVGLSSELITTLKRGNLFSFFSTIFHELIHVKQEYRIYDQCLSYNDLIQQKDKLISKKNRQYYKENYHNLSTEIESYSYEAQYSIEFMKYMHLKVTEEQIAKAKKELEKREQASQNLNRIYNDEEKHLFDIFDEFIKDKPHLLKNYTQLTFEYVEEDGLVRPKTKEELEETYKDFLSGTITFNTTEEELSIYKNFLIERKYQKIKKK